MPNSILIDGYNLIHALGLLAGKAGPGDVERSRQRLLGILKAGFRDRPEAVTVVFDASRGRGAEFQDEQGITIVFAPADREADDLIEDFIRKSSAPRQLAVVSNDHRLQQAASRRGATLMKCDDFLDWLDRRRLPEPTSQEEKQLSSTANERLLEEFKDLDGELRRFFDPCDCTPEDFHPG